MSKVQSMVFEASKFEVSDALLCNDSQLTKITAVQNYTLHRKQNHWATDYYL